MCAPHGRRFPTEKPGRNFRRTETRQTKSSHQDVTYRHGEGRCVRRCDCAVFSSILGSAPSGSQTAVDHPEQVLDFGPDDCFKVEVARVKCHRGLMFRAWRLSFGAARMRDRRIVAKVFERPDFATSFGLYVVLGARADG